MDEEDGVIRGGGGGHQLDTASQELPGLDTGGGWVVSINNWPGPVYRGMCLRCGVTKRGYCFPFTALTGDGQKSLKQTPP